ncbi:LysM domain-containing protein [Prosthecobacter debontii]|uniref:LysM domain-containing protein n=1 Tax=Prosthecobacter debontii TaxID=48467 RepID=A0A1T4YUV9_9BACT|nr:LysM peptidoglycan-binding domain-containing protein [Prosthecobacter debontii]SKB05463.1 LysM domain-containing protein [Prosthecobacter debontii]
MMPTAARLLSLAAVCSLLASCQNGQSSLGGNDPYVSNYGNDGGYNPYPGQTGYAQSGVGGGYSAPSYTPPPAPVEADPYAFHAPSSAPKTTSSSSSAKKTTTSSSSKPKSTPKSTAKKSSGSYKVAKGDTLYGIARKRGTTVAKIKSANGLSSDLIRPGQTLKIP